MKSFAQVYRDEINGVLELAAPIAAEVLHDMAVVASAPASNLQQMSGKESRGSVSACYGQQSGSQSVSVLCARCKLVLCCMRRCAGIAPRS